MGNVLDSLVIKAVGAGKLAPLYKRDVVPGLVRFGHLGEGCREYPRTYCIDLMVGTEIDLHPEVLRSIEKALSNPCALLEVDPWAAIAGGRFTEYSKFFQCHLAKDLRGPRMIELQYVANPTARKIEVSRVRTYEYRAGGTVPAVTK